MMKYTIAISLFVSAVFAQQSAFPRECISPCSGVLSISDSCANSTGYTFDADVILAQEYLNCICASSNTGIMNQYDLSCNIPANVDVCNVLSKPAKTLKGSWTPSRLVRLARPISILSQVSTAKISPELPQTFRTSLQPLRVRTQLRPQIWHLLLRYNQIWDQLLIYRDQVLHQLRLQLLQRQRRRCRRKHQAKLDLPAFQCIIWCYWDLRWCWAPM